MRLTGLFEVLDDRDQFAPDCGWCERYSGEDLIDFHRTHDIAQHMAAKVSGANAPQKAGWWNDYHEIFNREMNKRGYEREGGWRAGISTALGTWIKKPALKEALDDKDEFGSPCGYCMQYAGEVDRDRFHEKHEQAEIMAEHAAHEYGGWRSSAGRQKYSDIFNIEMWRFGYIRLDSGRGPWSDRPVEEALDDRDEFKSNCQVCRVNCAMNTKLDEEDYHNAHTAASQVAGPFPKREIYDAEMAKYGYFKDYILRAWAKEPVKEDLDDKDSFEPFCNFGSCYLRDDSLTFHDAHEEAETAAANSEERQREDDIDKRHDIYYKVFNQVMAKHGYLPEYVYGMGWWKPPVKEDLDDRDAFELPNVHHFQSWDSTEDDQHWTVQMCNADDSERLEGEYWVRGGMGKGMNLTANFSSLDENTAVRVLTNVSSISAGDYAVDWDQAVEAAQRELRG